MQKLSDEQLVQRIRSEQDPVAAVCLDELFGRHHARVASWCLRITNDPNRAADLAQEIFLKAFQKLDTFQGNSKFTTWLYTITRNHCLDELRARGSQPESAPESLLEEMPDLRGESAASAMQRRQAEELLRELMKDSLDDMEYKVLTLHYVHELSLDSVGRMMGLTNASGAKAYIVSAKRKLKRAHERWKIRNQIPTGGGNRVG